MTRFYSVAFMQKMVERLTGKNAISTNQLAKETGVRQQNLSRWLREGRILQQVEADKPSGRKWTVPDFPGCDDDALKKALSLFDACTATESEILIVLIWKFKDQCLQD